MTLEESLLVLLVVAQSLLVNYASAKIECKGVSVMTASLSSGTCKSTIHLVVKIVTATWLVLWEGWGPATLDLDNVGVK